MDDRPYCSAVNRLWLASNIPSWSAYTRALHSPRAAQSQILRDTIAFNADTAFGREHRFSAIDSIDDYRRHVPFRRYDDISPWIDRIAAGQASVLTRETVTRLVPTSGSSGVRKLIPFCKSLQSEFNRALSPWLVDLYASNPDLANGRAYWSITPAVTPTQAAATEDRTRRVPVGFDDDTEYLAGWMRQLVMSTLVMPTEIRRVRSMDAFRYITTLMLLRARDLRLISIWHPSYWPLLFQGIETDWQSLLRDIAEGRDASRHTPLDEALPELRATLDPQPERAHALEILGTQGRRYFWPNLQLISCWADGFAEHAASELACELPGLRLQPKGLLATEAFVSIPFGDARPLAIRSHFFEFIDDAGREYLADELAIGGEYEVIITTSGGLYRYRLGDRVRVTSILGRTPSLVFIGRADRVSDRFGEKLSDSFVTYAIARALGTTAAPLFAMLAPDTTPPRYSYTLYVESPFATTDQVIRRLDQALRDNPHYDYCRQLGQIAAPRLFRINRDASKSFVEHMQKMQGWGDIKPVALSNEDGWSNRFDGWYSHAETNGIPAR